MEETNKSALEVTKKMIKAKEYVSSLQVNKEGKNSFAKYEYFTPSQVKAITTHAASKFGLLSVFNMQKNEHGYLATLMVTDGEGSIIYTIPTDVPQLKGTNSAQMLGGAVTYAERYLLTTAFGISDDNLDFDSDSQHKVKEEKQGISEENFNKMLDKVNSFENSKNEEQLIKDFNLNKAQAAALSLAFKTRKK